MWRSRRRRNEEEEEEEEKEESAMIRCVLSAQKKDRKRVVGAVFAS
jgi:hypothetical protein